MASSPFWVGDRVELLVDTFDCIRGWRNKPTWRPGYVVAGLWDESCLYVKPANAPRRDRGTPWPLAKIRPEVTHG